MATAAIITKAKKSNTEFANSDFLLRITSLVNVLADTHFSYLSLLKAALTDTHFSYLSFLTAYTVPIPVPFLHHGCKCLIYDGFSENIPSCNTKISLEFAKMDQITDKNRLQLSLNTNFGMVRMRTTTIFERF